MASGPIISWQIDAETMETVVYFIFLDSKITAVGDYSHEIKRCLLLGRKAMTNLDSILKGRDIILPTKVHLVKAMVFLVVMYGCDSWTIKKTEHRRIDAFIFYFFFLTIYSKFIGPKAEYRNPSHKEYMRFGACKPHSESVQTNFITWRESPIFSIRHWPEQCHLLLPLCGAGAAHKSTSAICYVVLCGSSFVPYSVLNP